MGTISCFVHSASVLLILISIVRSKENLSSSKYIERAFGTVSRLLRPMPRYLPVTIGFVGRTGVGKSSLLNGLTEGRHSQISLNQDELGPRLYEWRDSI